MAEGDTIVALSSGGLPSGVAIIRISGPAAAPLLRQMTGGVPAPRRATLATFCIDGEGIDQGLALWFPAPHSFTGEDSAELQLHGSVAVVRMLLRWLAAQPRVRLAEAGEFTRRAFEGGKLDLTAAEGLGDLITAETEQQRRQALARADGVLARQVEAWRATLISLRAEVEARLDFADEGDVDDALPESFANEVEQLRAEMRNLAVSYGRGRIIREGFRVALAGPPNAGKSSLLNAMSRSDVAIVSDEPGTTRDVREVRLNLGGKLVILVDMAGLRDADGKAEAEGVRRARAEIAAADLVLWLVAPDIADIPVGDGGWRIATKADLGRPAVGCAHVVSAATGQGVENLLDALAAAAPTGDAGSVLLSHERDYQAVGAAAAELDQLASTPLELAAEQLRAVTTMLERLIGRVGAEDILDRLFAGFCIGK